MRGRHEKPAKHIDWTDKLIDVLADLAVGLILLLLSKWIE